MSQSQISRQEVHEEGSKDHHLEKGREGRGKELAEEKADL